PPPAADLISSSAVSQGREMESSRLITAVSASTPESSQINSEGLSSGPPRMMAIGNHSQHRTLALAMIGQTSNISEAVARARTGRARETRAIAGPFNSAAVDELFALNDSAENGVLNAKPLIVKKR